jgi:hypothetical protein
MDGTFKAAPKLFTQLYTMHIRVHGNFIPALVAFLPSKDEATYLRLLRLIRASAATANLVFAPAATVIHCDYELAVIRAVERELNLQPTGCLFHFGQCIYRRVQHVGLSVSGVCFIFLRNNGKYNAICIVSRLFTRHCFVHKC